MKNTFKNVLIFVSIFHLLCPRKITFYPRSIIDQTKIQIPSIRIDSSPSISSQNHLFKSVSNSTNKWPPPYCSMHIFLLCTSNFEKKDWNKTIKAITHRFFFLCVLFSQIQPYLFCITLFHSRKLTFKLCYCGTAHLPFADQLASSFSEPNRGKLAWKKKELLVQRVQNK